MRNLYARTFITALVMLGAAAHAASGRQAAPQLDWREFNSEAGGFSVKFPGTPRISQLPMNKGPLTLTRNAHSVSAGGYEFELEYVDMPAGYDMPELVLEGGISGIRHSIESEGGRLLTKEKVVRGTCEGLDATFAAPALGGKTGFAQARIFNSGQRYYFAIFGSKSDGEGARAAARTFVESLDIKDGCKAPLIPTPAPTAEPVRSIVEGTPDPRTGWRKIESTEHGFSVLMPGPAQRESRQTQVQPFPVFHHEFIYETADVIYSSEVFSDYPVGFYSTANSQENLLDVMIVGIKRNLAPLEFTYSESRKLNVGQYPGRDYTLTNGKDGARGRMQVYATPRRAYVFIAVDRGQTSHAPEIERFFSSIRVSPK